jgi:hypothetical protein
MSEKLIGADLPVVQEQRVRHVSPARRGGRINE